MHIIGDLPNELAGLFTRYEDIVMVVTDAGLDMKRLALGPLPPVLLWSWILMEAEYNPGIGAIIQAAQRYYPENHILGTALREVSPQGPATGEVKFAVAIRETDLSISIGASSFRYIEAASVGIGSNDGYEHERPRHTVQQSSFFLQSTPVTNAEFATFCDATGYQTGAELGLDALVLQDGTWRPTATANWRLPRGLPTGDDAGADDLGVHPDHPVVQVTWYDAGVYCRWLGEVSGLDVCLPTETQWEYAAAGVKGLRWAFGNSYEPGKANVEGVGTSPVGQYQPSDKGFYDLTGNVYEWCSDWYSDRWTSAGHEIPPNGHTRDPAGPTTGIFKILRGGSWFDTPENARCANRWYATPVLAAANWGFRSCVRLTDALVTRLVSKPDWPLRAAEMLK